MVVGPESAYGAPGVSPYFRGDFTTLHALPYALSGLSVLIAIAAAVVAVVYARRSAPGIVARAAARVEGVEADLDVRLRTLEGQLHAQAVHVENVLQECEKAAADAGKRQKAARRAEQAAEAALAAGPVSSLSHLPVGAPGRIAAIEAAARVQRP